MLEVWRIIIARQDASRETDVTLPVQLALMRVD